MQLGGKPGGVHRNVWAGWSPRVRSSSAQCIVHVPTPLGGLQWPFCICGWNMHGTFDLTAPPTTNPPWHRGIVADPFISTPCWASPQRGRLPCTNTPTGFITLTYEKRTSGCIIAAFGCCLHQLWTRVSSSWHHRTNDGGGERISGSQISHRCTLLRIASDRCPNCVIWRHWIRDQSPLWEHPVDWARWWSFWIRYSTSWLMFRCPLPSRLRPPTGLHCPIMHKMLQCQTARARHKSQFIIFLTIFSSSPDELDHGLPLDHNEALSVNWNIRISSGSSRLFVSANRKYFRQFFGVEIDILILASASFRLLVPLRVRWTLSYPWSGAKVSRLTAIGLAG